MLSDKAQALRASILRDYQFGDAEIMVLDKGLEALDTADKAQKELDDLDSMFYINRLGEPTPHPAVRVAKDARAQFFAAMKQLGLADPYGGGGGNGRGAQKGRRA